MPKAYKDVAKKKRKCHSCGEDIDAGSFCMKFEVKGRMGRMGGGNICIKCLKDAITQYEQDMLDNT